MAWDQETVLSPLPSLLSVSTTLFESHSRAQDIY